MREGFFMKIQNFIFKGFAGPSQFARFEGGAEARAGWNGDHNISVRALYFSLDKYVIPEVQKEHVNDNWTQEQIRAEAVNRLSLRSKESMQYYMGEIGDETERTAETLKQWDISETSPGVRELTTFYKDKRVSLRELWQHTKEFAQAEGKPEAYDAQEEKTQMAMQEAFISGSIESYVAPIWHPSGTVQLIQIIERDGNSLIARQIDVGVAVGRNLTPKEATIVMRDIVKLHIGEEKQMPMEYPHVMIAHNHVLPAEVVTLAKAQVLFAENDHSKTTKRTLKQIDNSLLKDPRDQSTNRLLDRVGFIEHDLVRNIKAPISELGVLIVDKKRRQTINERFIEIFGKKRKQEKPQYLQSQRLTLARIREKSENIQGIIQIRHKEMTKTVISLSFIAETHVAIGAIPLLLSSLTKEAPKSIKVIEKSIVRHKRKEIKRMKKMEKIRKKELKLKILKEFQLNMKSLSVKLEKRQLLKLKKLRHNDVLSIKKEKKVNNNHKKDAKIRASFQLKEVKFNLKKEKRKFEKKSKKPKEKKVLIKLERKKYKEKFKLLKFKKRELIKLVKNLPKVEVKLKKRLEKRLNRKKNKLEVKILLRKEKKMEKIRLKKREWFPRNTLVKEIMHKSKFRNKEMRTRTKVEKRRIRKIEKKLIQVYILWLVVLSKTNPKIEKTELMSKKPEVKLLEVKKVEHLGILSAIIWYLAQIRESNVSTNNMGSSQSNNLSAVSLPVKKSFSRHGVIFAYVS